jgi:HNH endonuclease
MRKFNLSSQDVERYLGISRITWNKYRHMLNVEPVETRRVNNSNSEMFLFSIEDVDRVKAILPKNYGGINNPTADEVTEYGSTIFWSQQYQVKQYKYVPVKCACGRVEDVQEYAFRRPGRPRFPLCRWCSAQTTQTLGEEHPSWVEGLKTSKDGYRFVHKRKLSKDEQDLFAPMFHSNNYASEHRLVVARSLGRPLNRNEHIHHKNGDKLDNRLENLQLVTPSEHASIELAWAHKEINRLKRILDKHNIPY